MPARVNQAAFAGNRPDGRGSSGPAFRSAMVCSMIACWRWQVSFCLQHWHRCVGEHSVVTPARDQDWLAGVGQEFDPAHDHRAVTGRLVVAKAVNSVSATSASDTHRPACSSKIAFGYRIGVQASSSIPAIATLTGGVAWQYGEPRPYPAGGSDHICGEERGAGPGDHQTFGRVVVAGSGAAALGGGQRRGQKVRRATDQVRRPLRSRVPAMTGAEVGGRWCRSGRSTR